MDARAQFVTNGPALAKAMTELQWELYRLSVVEEWQESPYKAAVIGSMGRQPQSQSRNLFAK